MRIALKIVSFSVFLAAASLHAEEPASKNVFGRCILPLGMEEGKIPDDAITASSSYETKSVGPQNARIRQEKNGGAWCPKAQISSAIREYLEVDLTRNHLIAWTETQGRFGNGQGQEYAEAFFLEYWRDDEWHQYKNLKGDRILRGNSNTYLVEKQKLDLPFVASRVRFVPYSQHPRTVCMRVEIYGCLWEQHVLSYSAPRGSSHGPEGCNVEDFSYDGVQRDEDGILVNGLGQLTDGILGEDSEILVPTAGGSNWVGWTDRNTVQLIFHFQDLREFENCTVHLARLPDRDVKAFSTLRLWFSLDGVRYRSEPDNVLRMPEDGPEVATGTVSVPLRSRLGRFVKLELDLASKWLLLSEVTFETVSGTRNLSFGDSAEQSASSGSYRNESEARAETSEKIGMPGFNETVYPGERRNNGRGDAGFSGDVDDDNGDGDGDDDEGENEGNNGDGGNGGGNVQNGSTPDAFPVGSSQTYIGLVSGLLTMIVLLLTCTTFLMKQRGRNKVALLQKHTALLCGSPPPGITINMKDVKVPGNALLVNGGLSRSRLSLKSKTDRGDRIGHAGNVTTPATPGTPATTPTSDPAYEEQYSGYEGTYRLFSDGNVARDANVSVRKSLQTSEYPDRKGKMNFVNDAMTESTMPTPYPTKRNNHFGQKVHEGYYAATDILTIKRREEQPAALSLFTPLRIREKESRLPRDLEPYDIQRVSRHRLRILDKLGEGSFGLVHLCEAKGIQNPEFGSVQNRQIVIVRSLWRGVVDSLRKDFTKDMRALAAIRDPNIARIIALVEEEPFGAVFEYGQLGDLPTFLENREKTGGSDAQIGYACCLNFIGQVASGMKYLESSNIPHCDLAARNCIVGQNLTIKISDHAVYCSKYDRHYYVDGCYAKIPLRWMAWEAVLLGKRSSRSDVWSYAVTVWEILTSCKEIPYADLTSEQVLENCSRWYHGIAPNERNQPRVLSRPSCCPDDLYRLMLKSWSKQPEDRPTFEEIYLYLERLGFA